MTGFTLCASGSSIYQYDARALTQQRSFRKCSKLLPRFAVPEKKLTSRRHVHHAEQVCGRCL